jgi:thiosulfate dehydrogenase
MYHTECKGSWARTGWRHFAALLALVTGCTLQDAPRRDTATAQPAGAALTWSAVRWQPPVVDSTPDDPYEAAVFRGLMLVTHTPDSLRGYTGASLACASCHLDDGRRRSAIPLAGVAARYPLYSPRDGAVITLEDRVNACMVRSLGGSRLPAEGRDMRDIMAYLAFLSRGVPQGEHLDHDGLPPAPILDGDSARGRGVYVQNCARCHGGDGAGMGAFTPVWGSASYSVGASLARRERAAAFIRRNMPFDTPGTLTDQQAFDVATYVTSMPRPDAPGKAQDWPNGDAPPDLPYATKGHAAFHPPRLLPRSARFARP